MLFLYKAGQQGALCQCPPPDTSERVLKMISWIPRWTNIKISGLEAAVEGERRSRGGGDDICVSLWWQRFTANMPAWINTGHMALCDPEVFMIKQARGHRRSAQQSYQPSVYSPWLIHRCPSLNASRTWTTWKRHFIQRYRLAGRLICDDVAHPRSAIPLKRALVRSPLPQGPTVQEVVEVRLQSESHDSDSEYFDRTRGVLWVSIHSLTGLECQA